MVEMHVDTEGKYTIGPSSTSPTKGKFPVYVGGVSGNHIRIEMTRNGVVPFIIIIILFS